MIKRILLCGFVAFLAWGSAAVNTQAADAEGVAVQEAEVLTETDSTGNYEYSVLEDGTVEITSYLGNEEKVIIPETLDGKKVTVIGDWAFYYSTTRKEVVIPNTVITIGELAFGDNSIETITLPDSLVYIGEGAFWNCKYLKGIHVPKGVLSIEDGAFDGCESLVDISVDSSNNSYMAYENVLYTKDGTKLLLCGVGKQECDILAGVRIIESSAFSWCKNLEKVSFPDGLCEIKSGAFKNCSKLDTIELPKSVETIGGEAFKNAGISKVTLKEGLITIGLNAFQYCTNLSEITLPKSLETLGCWAFDECTNLTKAAVLSMDCVYEVYSYSAAGRQEIFPESTTLYCYDNSTTKAYAEEYGRNYVLMECPLFADVSEDAWYYPFVLRAYNEGIMSGVGTDAATGLIKFAPEVDVTREQFVQILYNREGTPAVEYQNVFPDVPEQSGSAWYSNAVMWAVQNKLVSGYDNGKFGVGDKITREQVAVILKKYAEYKGYSTVTETTSENLEETFKDVESVHSWAMDSMCWAVEYGVMSGKSGGWLMPLGNASRAEAATMLLNMIDSYEK